MPRRPPTHVDSAALVGERLRDARERAGLTQRQLAFDGCTAAYISRIEAGGRIPSYQLLREFGRRLGVSADYLATGSEIFGSDDTSLMHAELLARTGDRHEAARLYRAALNNPATPTLAAAARAGLAQITFRAGEHEAAANELAELVDLPELSHRNRVAAADSLGRALVATARYEEAIALFERFLADARKRGDSAETIRFSVLLANTLLDRTQYGAAESVLAGVLDSAREAVDPVTRAGVYWSQSRLHSSQGRTDLAARYARLTLETLEVTEHTVFIATALLLVAQLENEQGHAKEALDAVEQAGPAIRSSGSHYEYALLQIERARALAALGEREEAISTVLGAVGLLRENAPMSSGRAFSTAASIFRELGDVERAVELYELALETLPVHDRHRTSALRALATIRESQGRPSEALELLKQALETGAPSSEPARD